MKITVQNSRTGEIADFNILDINLKLRVEPTDDGHYRVQCGGTYRIPELFDNKDDAIREMNGIKRDHMIALQEKEIKDAAVKELPPEEEDDDDSAEIKFDYIL